MIYLQKLFSIDIWRTLFRMLFRGNRSPHDRDLLLAARDGDKTLPHGNDRETVLRLLRASLDARTFLSAVQRYGFTIDKEDWMGVHMTGPRSDLIFDVRASVSPTKINGLVFMIRGQQSETLIEEGRLCTKDE